jgi:purine-binding chemotaxis protein CheW
MSHKAGNNALSQYLHDLTDLQIPENAARDHADELAIAAQLLEIANAKLIEESIELPDLSGKAVFLSPSDELDSAISEIVCKENDNTVETVSREAVIELRPLNERLPNRFQALFFDVAGLTLAIPLIELGGIIQMQELSKMPGKPNWFMGVLVKQEDRYHCVDTALWMMPERYTDQLQQVLNYTYAIQLGKTPWVLACSRLATTHELTHDDIKWRDQSKSKPWLAGMIKQKMCALIDASQLIELLESKPTKTHQV